MWQKKELTISFYHMCEIEDTELNKKSLGISFHENPKLSDSGATAIMMHRLYFNIWHNSVQYVQTILD